jgi:hypothetical protein
LFPILDSDIVYYEYSYKENGYCWVNSRQHITDYNQLNGQSSSSACGRVQV